MRWMLKAGAFKDLSSVPWGEAIYRFIQKHITHSIIPTPERVLQKFRVGTSYLEYLHHMLGPNRLQHVIHIDIGAGWMPVIPFLFYSAGVNQQILCDVRKNMEIGIVTKTLQIFREILQTDVENASFLRVPPMIEGGESLDSYFTKLGITYAAPYNVLDLTQKSGYKVITCTQVLLHLNKATLNRLLSMIASALAVDGGMLIATVHLYDLYSDFDKSISKYNKWKYSDFVWDRLINSRLMTYNRLTSSDYRRLLEGNGFEIVDWKVTEPTDSDLADLRSIRIHDRFRQIPERELAATHLFLAARLRGHDAHFSAVPSH